MHMHAHEEHRASEHRGAVHLLPRTAAADASEGGAVVARRAALLLAVVVAVAARCTVGALTALADLRGARRAGGLFVRGGDDLGGEVEPTRLTICDQPLQKYRVQCTHHSRRYSTPSGVSV